MGGFSVKNVSSQEVGMAVFSRLGYITLSAEAGRLPIRSLRPQLHRLIDRLWADAVPDSNKERALENIRQLLMGSNPLIRQFQN